MDKKRLQIEQLDSKFKEYASLTTIAIPPTGWIKAIRLALGMSMSQLASKLSISKQSIQETELREKEGTVSIKLLKNVANAMDMELVYGFVPKDGSLDELINRKAQKLAREIVLRTSNTMKLEEQENSKERIKKAIEERTVLIKQEMPKALWD